MVVTEPQMVLDPKFQLYYEKHVNRKVQVVSSVYVEECLTSAYIPEKTAFQVYLNLINKLKYY